MNIRFVTPTIHSYIDYPVVASLIGTPFLLGVGQDNPVALWLSVATGVAALVLTLLTNHETGLIRVLPYSLHLGVDRLVGAVFVAAPFVLGFTGLDAAYYWINGVAVLVTTFVLNAPASSNAAIVPAHA